MANFNKLGIYEKGIPLSYTWEKKFEIAKQSGFDFIEFSIDGMSPRIDRLNWSNETFEEIRNVANAYSMPFYSMACTANRYYPLGDLDDETRNKGIAIVRRAIEIAKLLGISIIQLPSYDVNGKQSNDQTKERFEKSIKIILEDAKKHNILIAIEILEDVPHFSKIEQGVEIISRINDDNLKLYADFGNVASIGINPEEDLDFDTGEVICCHVKDAVIGNCRNVPYGTGLVDFEKCFKHFSKVNYSGNFVAEVWCDENESFVPYLKEVSKFIRKYF